MHSYEYGGTLIKLNFRNAFPGVRIDISNDEDLKYLLLAPFTFRRGGDPNSVRHGIVAGVQRTFEGWVEVISMTDDSFVYREGEGWAYYPNVITADGGAKGTLAVFPSLSPIQFPGVINT